MSIFHYSPAHEIQIDADYIGAYLFESVPADPMDLVHEEAEWDKLPNEPPKVSGYRDADIQGVACWNCGHFTVVGDPDNDNDLDGICNLFESKADATKTCDRFVAHADLLRQGPHTSWTEDMQNMNQDSMGSGIMEANYADNSVLNAIQFASTDVIEEDGLVWKDILRTGMWDGTPTNKGVLKKTLRIIRDGKTDPNAGILALSEILENFDDGAVQYVTVPLTDDKEDHKNLARLNTGFVRKLKLVDNNGMSVLRAGIDFTEPDVKEKVLRKTIPDVSAGIPFYVTRRKDNKTFTAVLDHVCLTHKPFVSDLGPFGIAAADGDELPIEAWEQQGVDSEDRRPSPASAQEQPPASTSETEETNPESENTPEPVVLTHRELERAIVDALSNQLRLSPEYRVEDVGGTIVTISHRTSDSSWRVPFRITSDAENPVVIAGVDKWKLIQEEHTKQIAASDSHVNELTQARNLRELRLSQPTSTGGISNMSTLSLDGVELSDLPEAARASIQKVLDENSSLNRKSRETDIEARIKELEDLGFSDRPGALKFYRQVMLDDDNGPAVVLFSDQPEDKRERVSAIGILDRFIDALKAGDAVQFSDQHLASGSDKKPPKDATGEKADLETRVEAAKTGLYGDKSKRRTGRK